MSFPELFSALWLPLLFIAGAALVARREQLAYHRQKDEADDVFVYSPARLRRRQVGAALLALVGATLFLWEMLPPETAGRAATFVTALLAEVVLLVVVAVLDLLETARHHRAASDAAPPTTSTADPGRQTHTPKRRPR
jgi:hypothetical protein